MLNSIDRVCRGVRKNRRTLSLGTVLLLALGGSVTKAAEFDCVVISIESSAQVVLSEGLKLVTQSGVYVDDCPRMKFTKSSVQVSYIESSDIPAVKTYTSTPADDGTTAGARIVIRGSIRRLLRRDPALQDVPAAQKLSGVFGLRKAEDGDSYALFVSRKGKVKSQTDVLAGELIISQGEADEQRLRLKGKPCGIVLEGKINCGVQSTDPKFFAVMAADLDEVSDQLVMGQVVSFKAKKEKSAPLIYLSNEYLGDVYRSELVTKRKIVVKYLPSLSEELRLLLVRQSINAMLDDHKNYKVVAQQMEDKYPGIFVGIEK